MSAARTEDDDRTHVVPLARGGEVRFRADHGGIYLDQRWPGSRAWNTNRLPDEVSRLLAERLPELVAIARSTGRSGA